jgi:hypothetical protein
LNKTMNIKTNKRLLFLVLLVPALLVTLFSFAALLFSTADLRQVIPKTRPLHSLKPSFLEEAGPTNTPPPTSPTSVPAADRAGEVTAAPSPGKPPIQYLPELSPSMANGGHELFLQPVIRAGGGGPETAAALLLSPPGPTSPDGNQPASAVNTQAQPAASGPTASGESVSLANPSPAGQVDDGGNSHGELEDNNDNNDNDDDNNNGDDNENG